MKPRRSDAGVHRRPNPRMRRRPRAMRIRWRRPALPTAHRRNVPSGCPTPPRLSSPRTVCRPGDPPTSWSRRRAARRGRTRRLTCPDRTLRAPAPADWTEFPPDRSGAEIGPPSMAGHQGRKYSTIADGAAAKPAPKRCPRRAPAKPAFQTAPAVPRAKHAWPRADCRNGHAGQKNRRDCRGRRSGRYRTARDRPAGPEEIAGSRFSRFRHHGPGTRRRRRDRPRRDRSPTG